MKPQRKSASSASLSKQTKAVRGKSSESFLSLSQQSLSVSKVLIEKLMKLEVNQKPVHRHTSSEISFKQTNTKAKSTPKPVKSPLARSVPISVPLKAKEAHPLARSISELTTPTSQTQTRSCNAKEEGRPESWTSGVIELELKLTQRLKALAKEGDGVDSFDAKFPLYSEIFQQVVDRDRQFGTLLMKIKTFYEARLVSVAQITAPDKLLEAYAEQLKSARRKLQCYREERKLMLRKIEKLSKETLELGRQLEECEEDYERLKEKLEYIGNVDLEEMTFDETTWKYLVVENQSYHELFRKMQSEFKAAKSQEDHMLVLMQHMKDRGYPVEELEKELFPIQREEEAAEEEEDLDPIVVEPEKRMPKPKNVPRLQLELLQASPGASVQAADSLLGSSHTSL